MIEQQRRWGQERNFITIKSKEKQLERTKKLDQLEKPEKSIILKFEKSSNSGNDVLIVENLCKSFENKEVLKDINLIVHRNDRIFIIGPNGCGKSTLLKILCSEISQDSGEYCWGYNIQVGYYSQDQNNFDPDSTLFDEISNAYPNLTNTEIRNALAKFQFRHDDVFKLVDNLSGGEKVRLALCKMILSKHNVLLLDEPTNHLDIQSKEVLEDALLEFDGTIICVSHDRYLINKLSNKIFDMKTNPCTYYPYSYEEYNSYLEKTQSERNSNDIPKEKKISENKISFEQQKKLLSDIRKAKTKLINIEKEISYLENRKEECTNLMYENVQDYKMINDLSHEISTIETRVEELYIQIDETESILKELEKTQNE